MNFEILVGNTHAQSSCSLQKSHHQKQKTKLIPFIESKKNLRLLHMGSVGSFIGGLARFYILKKDTEVTLNLNKVANFGYKKTWSYT
jgi:hypothetical protein